MYLNKLLYWYFAIC